MDLTQSQYFAVGKITEEQAHDYADHKGIDKKEAESHLRIMLNCESRRRFLGDRIVVEQRPVVVSTGT